MAKRHGLVLLADTTVDEVMEAIKKVLPKLEQAAK
jgi:hypothetical protein